MKYQRANFFLIAPVIKMELEAFKSCVIEVQTSLY